MPDFDIRLGNKIEATYRVAKVEADFDVKPEHAEEHFVGEIKLPDKWSVGAIVGRSGTGKSTIAKQVFGDSYVRGYDYKSASVIDDMPKGKTVEEIEKAFYTVGFGSVPCWLKPYSVLSQGEKMRVDMARALLEKDEIVFDEFTSVVDRTVAQTVSLALSKGVRREGKRFVAVTCHRDILDWLEPDWVFDTDTMQSFFGQAPGQKRFSKSDGAGEASGRNLGSITI